MSEPKQDYVDELRDAVQRRYREATADAVLPTTTVKDFRPVPGIQLQTYGWLTTKGDLGDDIEAAAESIVDQLLVLEADLMSANPTASARVFLESHNAPNIFWKDPSHRLETSDPGDGALIKVRHDFAVRVPGDGPPEAPETPLGPIMVGYNYALNPPSLRDKAQTPTVES